MLAGAGALAGVFLLATHWPSRRFGAEHRCPGAARCAGGPGEARCGCYQRQALGWDVGSEFVNGAVRRMLIYVFKMFIVSYRLCELFCFISMICPLLHLKRLKSAKANLYRN